jgi:hypothetical protein
MKTDLSTATLADCEDVIQHAIEAWMEAGAALQRVRDGKLYRPRYRTFEEYCHRRWNFGDARARQIIGAAETAQIITAGNGSTPTPANESVVRPLVYLRSDPEELRNTWQEAVTHANENGRTTPIGHDVQVAVKSRAMGPVNEAPQEPENGSDRKVDDLIVGWGTIGLAVKEALAREHEIYSEHDLTDNQRWRLNEAKRHVWIRLADEF